MKSKYLLLISLFFFLTACWRPEPVPVSTTKYKPILMKRSEMEKIVIHAAIPLQKTGKIYVYGKYLFVNESKKGVHIIDYSKPYFPENLGFLLIPGNEDIAIKNNIIYADNGTDIVAIDMTNPMTPTVVTRLKDALAEKSPPDYLEVPSNFQKSNRPSETIIVSWE